MLNSVELVTFLKITEPPPSMVSVNVLELINGIAKRRVRDLAQFSALVVHDSIFAFVRLINKDIGSVAAVQSIVTVAVGE